MNFEEIVTAAKAACAKSGGPEFLLGWGVRDFCTKMSRIMQPGWEKVDLKAPDIDPAVEIPALFSALRETFQMIGMSLSSGEPQHDADAWEQLTQALTAFREVLVQNYQVDLPPARVISMVEEMVEDGLLEQKVGDDGQTYVSLKKEPCALKIRITQTPAGNAPEEIRQKWVGLVLPANRVSLTPEVREMFSDAPAGYEECYAVPLTQGMDELRKVLPEGADWFLKNFGVFGDLLFHANEAEVVAG